MNGVKIHWESVPKMSKHLLGASAYPGLVEHFNNPENQRRFEQWQKERGKQTKCVKR